MAIPNEAMPFHPDGPPLSLLRGESFSLVIEMRALPFTRAVLRHAARR